MTDAGSSRTFPRTRRRFRRRAATIAARCAMASWVVLAAMPVLAVVATYG